MSALERRVTSTAATCTFESMKLKSYESDTTKFIREFLDKNPQLQEKRQRARGTWWDRPQDLDERRREEQSEVPQAGYVYYNNP